MQKNKFIFIKIAILQKIIKYFPDLIVTMPNIFIYKYKFMILTNTYNTFYIFILINNFGHSL